MIARRFEPNLPPSGFPSKFSQIAPALSTWAKNDNSSNNNSCGNSFDQQQ